ncbi:putative C4-dicarboxylate transporter/malic acid transport protein [Cryphonectria parasitica EP155]|uniref:Sulfite efflux pump SSU1 n=1 Tax=Cryphonectria parasitica (strain ATCC 38755 / EP155) TaxID=660469 RepID=A0A9P4Y7Z7_CRYP1|nr:putative C4-dicarboxylate transporter/malic acid transport protein [Cryphonectria parasitica EP155]KAF3767760.1 putative C4-dicarboxylate transporter/malic acid transport protein [Cryphonectria parasitica EP155]
MAMRRSSHDGNSVLTQQADATSSSSGGNGDGNATKEEVGWRRIVRNFTPSWFAVNMGTGIVSILFHSLPYTTSWTTYVAYVFFAINVALFLVSTGITIARYVLYPEIWTAMVNHAGQSLFLGTFPMGLATIINMIVFSCSQWGDGVVYFAWALWWLDVVLSLACCISMPFMVLHRHRPQLQQTTAALLLPVVPAVVASASGGILAAHLPSRDHAVTTLVASYVLWGLGEAFTMCILAMYFHRLMVHHLPPRELIVSVFLPVGPLGQGGFAIQQLGSTAAALDFLPLTTGADAGLNGGQVLRALGVFLALVMWGAGLGWLVLAATSIATTQSFPFNMGWWGFTFPLGVFATCTGMLAQELDSLFFRVTTMIFSISVILLWLLVAARTLLKARTGEIFVAPCLADLRPKTQQADADRTV